MTRRPAPEVSRGSPPEFGTWADCLYYSLLTFRPQGDLKGDVLKYQRPVITESSAPDYRRFANGTDSLQMAA